MVNNVKSIYDAQLRPNDFDIARQLNNSVYLQLLEMGRWDWAEKNKIDLSGGSVFAVAASLNIDYLRPIEWAPIKHVQIETALDRVSFYSVYLEQNIFEKNVVAAKASIRIAIYDANQRVALPIKGFLS